MKPRRLRFLSSVRRETMLPQTLVEVEVTPKAMHVLNRISIHSIIKTRASTKKGQGGETTTIRDPPSELSQCHGIDVTGLKKSFDDIDAD